MSILTSKMKIKPPQISAISDKYIKINPYAKGAIHDSLLKLKNDIGNVVVKVSIFNEKVRILMRRR